MSGELSGGFLITFNLRTSYKQGFADLILTLKTFYNSKTYLGTGKPVNKLGWMEEVLI